MEKEPLPNFEVNRTLDELQQIRSERDANRVRILGVDTARNTPDEPYTLSSLNAVTHPDGMTNIQVSNNDELAADLIAVYSDERGVFGLYDNGQAEQDAKRPGADPNIGQETDIDDFREDRRYDWRPEDDRISEMMEERERLNAEHDSCGSHGFDLER